MARDNGIFFARTFAKIKYSLDVPVYTILACSIFNALFGLLYLGPTVAFTAYMSSCTIFLNVSYAMPIICLLIRGRSELAKSRYPSVPHQLGKWGWTVNIVAALFVVMTTVVSSPKKCSFHSCALCVNMTFFLQLFSFPPALPVTSSNMSKSSENCRYDLVQIALTKILQTMSPLFLESSLCLSQPSGWLTEVTSQDL